MTTLDQTHLERQLSSLFRAEAQDAHLPLGTWQEIAPKMGEPDRQSLFGLIRDALRIPLAEKMWRNPMRVRYVAPAATIVLALLIALLFILLVNDTDDDNSLVPAQTPTVPVGTPTLVPTFTPLPATATVEPEPTETRQEEQQAVALIPGQWVEIASPPNQRFTHQLIRLDDGRIMSVGGRGPDGPVLVADIYDITTNTWVSTPPLSESREQAGIVKLDDGRVLVAGGEGVSGLGTSSAEVYDPETDQWSPVASMSVPRYRHLSIVLADRRVLVSGGREDDENFILDQSGGQSPAGGRGTSNEIYDPASDTWTSISPRQYSSTVGIPGYHFQQEDLRMVQLPDGTVLAPPTQARDSQSAPEYWNPETDTWSVADDLPFGYFALSDYVWVQSESGAIAVNSWDDPHVLNPETLEWEPMDRGEVAGSEVVDVGDGRFLVQPALPLNDRGQLDITASLPEEWRLYDPDLKSWADVVGPPVIPELPEFVAVRPGLVMQVGGRLNPIQYADSAYIMQLPPS